MDITNTKNKFGKVIAALSVAAIATTGVVTAISSSASATGPTLYVYSAQGYDSAAVDAFNATNPGFTVALNDGSTGPLLQEIQAERNNPRFGVLWVDGPTAFATLDKEGLLARHIVPKGVNFNARGKANIPTDGSFVPADLTATGALVWDSAQMSASELPKTWNDLTLPKFRGWLGMNDPTQSGPTYPLIAGVMANLGAYKGGSPAKAIAVGEKFFTKLKANGLVVNATNGPTVAAILAHQIKMAIIQSSAGYGKMLTGDPTLRVSYLKPATALAGGLGIDAKMPWVVRQEAQKFVNWVMSSAGQHVMQTGDPQGDSLFWPVITGENQPPSLPALHLVPLQTINPYVWGPQEAKVNAWFVSHILGG